MSKLRKPLELEINKALAKDATNWGGGVYVMCEAVLENWIARVRLTDEQAIVAFPKFGTVGIGFQVEKANWNTNLPAAMDVEVIYKHIACNKGDRVITKAACLEAIRLLQPYAASWLGKDEFTKQQTRLSKKET